MAEKKTTAKKAAPKKDVKELTLAEQLVAARKDLLDAQKSHKAGELVNPQVLKEYRRTIARIMTKLSAQEGGK